ncbi:phosphatase PAP2 family protein, partial [Parabacteroides sp. OttesenSCG-928-G07]|nr:phosphatase PAP2 family protein [Parabacteroides sp. OttesenSCG-928-G07]
MRTSILTCLFALFIPVLLMAQEVEVSSGRKGARVVGDILMLTLPAADLAITLVNRDWEGLAQGSLSGVTAVSSTFLLKSIIDKQRPDKSDYNSFPSMHSAISFAGAAFLQRRYGWKWGAPAYAVAAYVGWSRVYGKKHDWWDVVAGAAIGIGSVYAFTRPLGSSAWITCGPVTTTKSTVLVTRI